MVINGRPPILYSHVSPLSLMSIEIYRLFGMAPRVKSQFITYSAQKNNEIRYFLSNTIFKIDQTISGNNRIQ